MRIYQRGSHRSPAHPSQPKPTQPNPPPPQWGPGGGGGEELTSIDYANTKIQVFFRENQQTKIIYVFHYVFHVLSRTWNDLTVDAHILVVGLRENKGNMSSSKNGCLSQESQPPTHRLFFGTIAISWLRCTIGQIWYSVGYLTYNIAYSYIKWHILTDEVFNKELHTYIYIYINHIA